MKIGRFIVKKCVIKFQSQQLKYEHARKITFWWHCMVLTSSTRDWHNQIYQLWAILGNHPRPSHDKPAISMFRLTVSIQCVSFGPNNAPKPSHPMSLSNSGWHHLWQTEHTSMRRARLHFFQLVPGGLWIPQKVVVGAARATVQLGQLRCHLISGTCAKYQH